MSNPILRLRGHTLKAPSRKGTHHTWPQCTTAWSRMPPSACAPATWAGEYGVKTDGTIVFGIKSSKRPRVVVTGTWAINATQQQRWAHPSFMRSTCICDTWYIHIYTLYVPDIHIRVCRWRVDFTDNITYRNIGRCDGNTSKHRFLQCNTGVVLYQSWRRKCNYRFVFIRTRYTPTVLTWYSSVCNMCPAVGLKAWMCHMNLWTHYKYAYYNSSFDAALKIAPGCQVDVDVGIIPGVPIIPPNVAAMPYCRIPTIATGGTQQ